MGCRCMCFASPASTGPSATSWRPCSNGTREAHHQARPGVFAHPCGLTSSGFSKPRWLRPEPGPRLQRGRRRARAAAGRRGVCRGHLLGRPAPPEVPFEEAELSPMARSFYAESKQVSTIGRIKRRTGLHAPFSDLSGGPQRRSIGHDREPFGGRGNGGEIALGGQPVIAALDERELSRRVTRIARIERQRMCRHGTSASSSPCTNVHRAGDLDALVEDQVSPPVLDQLGG
jgi:hypothetical protein